MPSAVGREAVREGGAESREEEEEAVVEALAAAGRAEAASQRATAALNYRYALASEAGTTHTDSPRVGRRNFKDVGGEKAE